MDSKHELEAPNEADLKSIEQVSDHSELSSLYKRAKTDLGGDLVNVDEREERRQKKYDAMSFGVRKHFASIGLLVPLPLVLATAIVGFILTFINEQNAPMLVVPMIFVFFIWITVSFFMYKKAAAILYDNALQAGPFILILLTYLVFSLPAIYSLTLPLHNDQLITGAAVIGGIEIVWSVILSALLLFLWTTPRVSGALKALALCIIGVALAGFSAYLYFM